MNKDLILRVSMFVIITASLTACDGLARSEFQNEYIKKCNAEGKNSSSRCECMAEKIDSNFDKKTKQLILNPTDNPMKVLDLLEPLDNLSSQCIDDGR